MDDFRFWQRVSICGPDDCWPWTSYINHDGYGQYSTRKNGSILAHRMAFALANEAHVGPGVVIRHSCDNRICCNPRHLLAGTHKDNVADRVSRGRSATAANGAWAGGRRPEPNWELKERAQREESARGVDMGLAGLVSSLDDLLECDDLVFLSK